MNKVLVLQNVTRERPGFILDWLESKQVSYTKVDLSKAEAIPSFDQYGAMVVLGGYDSANDESHKIQNEIVHIKKWIMQERPYLGICLGLQVLVKAAGGSVVPFHEKEIGLKCKNGNLYTLLLTPEGEEDALFQGLTSPLHFFQLHEDTVELANYMKVLALGDHCSNQAVKIGSCAYGLQCHFEINEDIFERWLQEHPDLSKMDADKLRKEFREVQDVHMSTGEKIFENFLSIANVL